MVGGWANPLQTLPQGLVLTLTLMLTLTLSLTMKMVEQSSTVP